MHRRVPKTDRRFARVLCGLFVIAFALALLPFVHAANEPAEAIPLIAPVAEADALLLESFEDGYLTGWIQESGVSKFSFERADGIQCLKATAMPEAENNSYAVLRLFGAHGRLNLLTKSRVTATLKIAGDADTLYTVSIRLFSGMAERTAEVKIPGGSWYAVSVGIEDWNLRLAIDAAEIRVTDANNGGVDHFLIGNLTASGEASLDVANTFLTLGFTADGGTAEYKDGIYALNAGGDGIMTLLADAARADYTPAEGTMALRIVISGAKEGGTVSLAVSDAFSGTSSFEISSSCQLYSGTNTYLLPFSNSFPLYAYRLSFYGLFSDSYLADGVHLVSVSLVNLPDTDENSLAKISAFTFGDALSSLTVKGSLSSDTVAEFIDSTLCLYEIPVWADPHTVFKTDEPLSEMKISTRFSFEVNLKGREATAAVSRYALVLKTDTEVIPLAAARFPDMPISEAPATRSPVGLAGADAAGAFAANAANVIIDVYVDELLGGADGNTSGRLCVRGGRHYYLDYEYLRKLDDEINFYIAADIDVYLRLLSKTDLSSRGFTFSSPEAELFAFDVQNEDGAYMLSAVTDYIASHYQNLRGFILGDRLDSALYTTAALTDENVYAALCADTMRIIYTAAATHIPGITVIAPIGNYSSETDAGNVSPKTSYDPVLLIVYLSQHITKNGEMPWGMLYISGNSLEMVGHAENILGRMKAVETAIPDEFFLLWQPPFVLSPESLFFEYEMRGAMASKLNPRVFFLDVGDQEYPDTLYNELKYVEFPGDTGRHLTEANAQIFASDTTRPMYKGSYTLYNFKKSFSTLHWIAGSGCTTLTTQSGIIADGERTMHADFSNTDDPFLKANGNILCMMPAALDFTRAPIVTVKLLAASSLESTDSAELVFVFGSGDARAEYEITVPVGQVVTVACDLSDYAGASHVNSAAILVKADSAVTLDIAHMYCFSETHTSDELTEHFTKSLTGDTGIGVDGRALTFTQIALLSTVFVITLSVFALLTRRGRQD